MADFRGLDQAIMQLYALEAAPLRVFGQALMRLHASRFAEMLGMGMSLAGMQLHASRFAEMFVGLIVRPGVPI